MSRQKTERLVSLVVCLLSTRRYLTSAQIQAAVPGYPQAWEPFKRMFERDKDELREIGIPLEIAQVGPEHDVGYRIPRQAYELPEIVLEPGEAAVLGLAARVWGQAGLSGAAAAALLKLRAAGIDAEDATEPGIEPRLETAEPAFGPLWQAVRDGRTVTFRHQAAGRVAAQTRNLAPWGVVNRHGRWYVVGLDTDRGEERVFRLSRIAGDVTFTGPPGSVTVPPGTDVRQAVRGWDEPLPAVRTAELSVRHGAGVGLRRRAAEVRPSPDDDGWDLVQVQFSDSGWYADYLASFGPDVIVLEPADLREAVIRRLKGALT